MGYAGIIRVLEAFFGHVCSAFGICVSVGVFAAVCDSLWPLTVRSVHCYGCCTQNDKPTVCRAAVEMYAQKKRRRNFLNVMKDRVLDMHKHCNTNLYKEVVEGIKEGGCVCMVEQVHHWWKTLKTSFQSGSVSMNYTFFKTYP